MPCFSYGGPTDPCTLNCNNDNNCGLGKDPSACRQDTFYLWDEPQTQHKTNQWAATAWMQYADRWSDELQTARDRGMKITTPFFTGGDVMSQFATFFGSYCESCSNPGSKYYLDVIAFNAWIGSWGSQSGQEQWIQQQAASLKKAFPGRPVYLTNYGYLGGHTASQQDAIINGRIYDRTFSGLDAVYYFGAKDVSGQTFKNSLHDIIETGKNAGRTIGQVLAGRCNEPVPASLLLI